MKKLIIVTVLLFIFLKINTAFAWDTTAAKFYPLSVGNYYVFERINLTVQCVYPQFGGYYTVKIVSDTILSNNKKYFVFNNFWEWRWKYQRIDSNSMNVYFYHPFTFEENLLDSLYAKKGDTFLGYRNPEDPLPAEVIDTIPEFHFNNLRINKIINAPGLMQIEYSLLEGIGLYTIFQCEYGLGERYTLKGCIIDGVLYGDTSLSNIHIVSNKIPNNFALHQNYPNPFNSQTTIEFDIKKKGDYSLVIYDCLGRKRDEVFNQYLNAGSYSISFNGDELQSGVYFYRLSADGDVVETRRMALVK